MVTVGPLGPDRLRDFFDAMGVPFSFDMSDEEFEEATDFWDPDWLTAAVEGDMIVGTFGSFPLEMRLPGGRTVPTGGTTVVTVLPTHRRRGVLTALMTDHLDRERDRGAAMAALWASEAMIYGRFGYGIATDDWSLTLPRQHAALSDPPDISGRVRLIDAEEATEILPPLFEAAHAARPGTFERSEAWWRHRILRDPSRHRNGYTAQRIAVVARDGRDVAYARWRTKGGPDGVELVVTEFVGLDAEAERDLWQFLFGVDLVTEIKLRHSPSDLPLRWWLVDARKLERKETDALWVRPLDVAACLENREYAADGSITLGVDDPHYDDNTGTWRLEVTDGTGVLSRTETAAEVSMGIDALGSILLGGFGAESLATAGRIAGPPESVRRLDRMFSWPVSPWVQEVF